MPVSAPPYFVLAGAQVLLGVWLGLQMFKRELFVRSPMLLVAVLASTAVLLLSTAIMADCPSAG